MSLINIVKKDYKNIEIPVRKVVKNNNKNIKEGEKNGYVSKIYI